MNEIIVFTDGSYANSQAGCGIYYPNREFSDSSFKFMLEPLTNQRAELYAIYVALKQIVDKYGNSVKIILYTDSEYSIKSLTIWIYSWIKNGWRKQSDKKAVKNKDLFLLLYPLVLSLNSNLNFQHVRSHTNKQDYASIGNQIADLLATKPTKSTK
jgi:ribonuclease HI